MQPMSKKNVCKTDWGLIYEMGGSFDRTGPLACLCLFPILVVDKVKLVFVSVVFISSVSFNHPSYNFMRLFFEKLSMKTYFQ